MDFGDAWVTTSRNLVCTIKITPCSSKLLIPGDYLDINECFVEKPDFQLSANTMGVESVEFKDDCLRACLRSQLRGKPCAGVEHRPKDNSCILSDKTGERRPTNEQKRGSYYENVCARPPG
ncbi:PAN domain protein [Ancylostoma caninum]|uniref:PAN domain protein n=1 Tax=Ancylostoma caninum TaxID=29170 RepID=A0A368FA73_ANCCA|nr:PAN domain protein [Ancylostoma caninum]